MIRFDSRRVDLPTRFEWAILAYGVLLRLTQYLSGRSPWMDESMLALNVVNRSFAQLLQPLDYNQGAPVGFLMAQRAAVQLFGPGEYALRLFPFICGLISLLFFYYLAKKCLEPGASRIALALFAIVLPLIYYSSEAKQYSSDVAVALGLLSLAVCHWKQPLTARRIALLGLAGALAVWFSHPALFVLAGIGAGMILFRAPETRWAEIGRLSVIFSVWVVGFALCYFVSLRSLAANGMLLNYWSFSFPPSQPVSVAGVEWFLQTFFAMFQEPVGLDLSGLAALAFLVGCISMYWNKKRYVLGILLAPLIFTFMAAAFHKYPFNGRLLLFLVPALLLLIAEGAQQIWHKTRSEVPLVGACFMGLLFLYPVLFSAYHLVKPNTREEIKPAMSYIKSHSRAGDFIYVQQGAIPAFRYYLPRFKSASTHVLQGNPWEDYVEDVDHLAGLHRVWVLFAHRDLNTGIDDETLLLDQLDKKGKRLDSFKSVGAAAFLYDFNASGVASRLNGQ